MAPACRPVAVLAVAALLLAGCSDVAALRDRQVPGAAVTVHMIDSPKSVATFEPTPVHVRIGQTVAWVNASGNYHTVTFSSGPGVRSSAGIEPGGTFQATFRQPGVYRYRCLYHPPMLGEVDVTSGPTPLPSPPPTPPTS